MLPHSQLTVEGLRKWSFIRGDYVEILDRLTERVFSLVAYKRLIYLLLKPPHLLPDPSFRPSPFFSRLSVVKPLLDSYEDG